jgi:hypothetical protein
LCTAASAPQICVRLDPPVSAVDYDRLDIVGQSTRSPGSSLTLPGSIMALDLSQISLFRATQAQKIESRKRTHVLWSRGLSLEAYLKRDERLEQHELARDGRWITWYARASFSCHRNILTALRKGIGPEERP